MGPRKALATRGKRAAEAPVTEERRTKHRHDPSQPIPPSVPLPQALSIMGNRAVTSGRNIDLDFLDSEGFKIAEWIRRQHWERFCKLNLPYYPSLVRNFFENLRIGTNSVQSTVKDTLIVLTEERLGRILAIPKTGKCFLTLQDKEKALKVILNKEKVTDLGSLLAGQLNLEMRLLHNITSRVFLPKTGRFDWVSEREIIFMFYMTQGEPVNLPYLMLNQIKEAAKGKRACLPYGMVFTLVFNEFGINLEGEISKKLLHTDTYNEKSLFRMGYFKKNNIWTKKSVSKKQSESESEESEEEEENRNEENEESEEEEEEREEEENRNEENEESEEEEEEREEEGIEANAPAENVEPTVEPTASSPTAPTTQQSAQFSSDLFEKFSELMDSKFEALVGRFNESISQSNQQVIKSYEELKGDIRDLTLRVDTLEHKQRSQDALHSELIGLRSEFGRMRGAADRVLSQQDQDMSTVLQAVKEMKVGVESMMICLLGSSNPFGGASTSSRPTPQPSPRPPPHYTPRATPRPPFNASVRSGTGFPEPTTSRAGVSSRPSRARGQASFRSSKIHAPYTVSLPDDSDTESSE